MKKMQKGGRINPTARKTAMTALGVKKKSNEFSPSRFGEKANPTTGSKMMKGGTKKMQSGGTLTSPQYIKDLNNYLQKGVLEDIRRVVYGPKKSTAKKPVIKKSAPKKA